MAIGLPFHDPSWSPADAVPEATPTAAGAEARAGSLDLALVRAVIEDGLLMVFGPDGDPIPPEIFAVAAAEQPDAGIRLRDGLRVAAGRIAVVLDAQRRGHLGSAGGGAGADPFAAPPAAGGGAGADPFAAPPAGGTAPAADPFATP